MIKKCMYIVRMGSVFAGLYNNFPHQEAQKALARDDMVKKLFTVITAFATAVIVSMDLKRGYNDNEKIL